MLPDRLRVQLSLAAAAFALLGGNARAEVIYGVTNTGIPLLVSFDSATPGTLTTIGAISGLVAGQTLRGIDFRPSNGQLYALSNAGSGAAAQLYTVNLTTGALTTVGSGLTLPGNTSSVISIDFNPVVDALRVVTIFDQNYRVNANIGALIAQDTSISPAAGSYADIAYSNNVVGATSTTLYAYEFSNDIVGTIGSVGGTPTSPNTGQFFPVGSSGVTAGNQILGFDISGATGIGYANLLPAFTSTQDLYTVDLGTGAFNLVGSFSAPLLDISVQPLLPAVVPEPGMLALASLGLLSLAGTVWRRRRE